LPPENISTGQLGHATPTTVPEFKLKSMMIDKLKDEYTRGGALIFLEGIGKKARLIPPPKFCTTHQQVITEITVNLRKYFEESLFHFSDATRVIPPQGWR